MADKSAQVKIGHYILGETLGVGTFGKVKSKLTDVGCGYDRPMLLFRRAVTVPDLNLTLPVVKIYMDHKSFGYRLETGTHICTFPPLAPPIY